MASACFVVWQNSRLTILWDASYVLESAARIAAGDVPSRDFPFPYAPLTFALQAAIIRLFGRAYWHHIAYAALACGVATAMTFAVARSLVSPRVAVILCVPLALLGIYCIFPHPFYDPDACLVILAVTAALFAWNDSLIAGALCVVPLFVKQNIGMAFVAAVVLFFAIERRWRVVSGVILGGALGAMAVAWLFGIENYLRWTVRFAAARRLPPLTDVTGMFAETVVWWCAGAIVGGALLLRSGRVRWLGAIALVAPWIWMAVRFYATDDPTEREINLLRLWPVTLLAATVIAIARARNERGARRAFPFVIIATVLGCFLSQGNWGSTYGIWPLLVPLLAIVFDWSGAPLAAAAFVAAVTVHSALPYVANNDRLAYAKWSEGPLRSSTLPALRGLRMHGDWLPQFEQLVTFAGANIPREDGILFLPGEDLFYFATGRRPRFPVLMFDHTVNPYSPWEIASMAEARGIRWVIVKRRLQINGEPFPERDETLALLRARFAPFARLSNYDVYARVDRTSRAGPRRASGFIATSSPMRRIARTLPMRIQK